MDPPVSIVVAIAAVVAATWVVKSPVYVELLPFPVSVSTPSVVKEIAVEEPWLINRKGDPAAVTHEWPDARATVVLQIPSVGDTAPNDVNEKSRTPPANTMNGFRDPAGRFEIVPVPEVKVPPE